MKYEEIFYRIEWQVKGRVTENETFMHQYTDEEEGKARQHEEYLNSRKADYENVNLFKCTLVKEKI